MWKFIQIFHSFKHGKRILGEEEHKKALSNIIEAIHSSIGEEIITDSYIPMVMEKHDKKYLAGFLYIAFDNKWLSNVNEILDGLRLQRRLMNHTSLKDKEAAILLEKREEAKKDQFKFKMGDTVKIQNHSEFQDLEGVIIKDTGKNLEILVKVFGQEHSVVVKYQDVEIMQDKIQEYTLKIIR